MKIINNKIAMAVCFALTVSACSSDKTIEEYLSAAKASISNSNDKAAIVALKNAVRVDLKNAEARILLGSVYLKMGDAVSAEKELRRAIDLNGDIENTVPKLLKALNLQKKNDEMLLLIEKFEQNTPETLLYQALAYDRLGDKDNKRLAIELANEISTQSIYSQLGDAYLKIDALDNDGALINVNEILAINPDLVEALLLKGQLHFAKKEYNDALIAFNKYHKLMPRDIQIKLFLANAYFKNSEFEQAEIQVNDLLKISPEHPFINQLKGLLYYQKADFKNALAHTIKAIQNGLDNTSNRVVAGLSAFKLEQFELSHQHLIAVSEALPPSHVVHRILALIQMELGYNISSGDTIAELEDLSPQDVSLITAVSFELLKKGEIEEAQKLLAKTEGLDIDNSEEMTKIGILKLSMNDIDGLADLEKSVEIDPNLPMAKVALAAAYIKTQDYDKALEVAEKWKKEKPEEIEGYNLAAKVYLLQNNTLAAEEQYNHALSINENSAHSILYFAGKAFAEKKYKDSVASLKKLFFVSPHHLSALSLNYQANKALKTPDLAVNKIAESYSLNLENQSYQLLYSKVLYNEEQYEEVIKLLKDIKDPKTAPALQWVLLGDSYSKNNENIKALDTYLLWTKSQPQTRLAWLKKAALQESLRDYKGALLTIEEALRIAPNDEQFKTLRVNYLVLTNDFSEAQNQLDKLSLEYKALSIVKGLQGKIHLVEGKYEQAEPGIMELYTLIPSPYNTSILFATYRKLGLEKRAFSFLQEHVENYEDDYTSRNLLAENAISYDLSLSQKHYRYLLTITPNSISKLNNLAWVEYLLENYVEAESIVNRALKLDGNHPKVLDTAGLIQLKLGNKKKSLELLNKAKSIAPNDKDILKHYQEANSKN